MNNRSTLYTLVGLAVAAFAGSMFAESNLEYWEDALLSHQRRYKTIWEQCDDLEMRREKAPKGSDEQSFRLHFQTQAYTAQMGDINVSVNSRTRSSVEDKIFKIEFAKGENGFRRDQLRTFLFNAELLYPRVRTTALVIKPHAEGARSRGIDTGVERIDLWDITKLELRQRSPKAKR
ncbi:MAG TPA: hypothetical protein EYN86_06115 [Planctomycetes bacterium]|jgi:hypothetical protein|nr:hypothetical protein [Planctomycetota bacterium]